MPDSGWTLPFIVFTPFVAAIVTLCIGRFTGKRSGWIMVFAAAVSFMLSLQLFMAGGSQHEGGHALHNTGISLIPVANAEPISGQIAEHATNEAPAYEHSWIDAMSIELRFMGDRFGLFFAMLVSGIGVLVGLYSTHYIPDLSPGRIGRYYAALIAFMGAMLGVALSDDLILLFVFWEITSIASFMLIGFWYEQDIAKKGALTALQVTGLGGLAMIVGFILVGIAVSPYTSHPYAISELIANDAAKQALIDSPLFLPAMLCIFAGAFTKSAQFPFHFWLPNAMVAPTPVSTYLHSATMVKAGIFLVGRVMPLFDQNEYWSPILISFGLVTFSLAAYQSFRETDLKAVLARTTLSTLGLVMLIYGLKEPGQDALQLFNHAAYKASLFLVVGIIEHATHTRDMRELGGLRKLMPVTFVLCLIASLSMAGLPPFFGFVAKESLYHTMLSSTEVLGQNAALKWFVIAVAVGSNAFIFAVSFKLIIGLFFGKTTEKASHAHEAGLGLLISPTVLVTTVVVMGLLAWNIGLHHSLADNLVNNLSSAAESTNYAPAHVGLIPDLAHPGPLILSLCTIGLGVLIYRSRTVVVAFQDKLAAAVPPFQMFWDKFLASITWFAENYSSRWQSGSLWWYLWGTLAFFVGLTGYGLYKANIDLAEVNYNFGHLSWWAIALLALLIVAAFTVVQSRTRLAAAIAVTAVGFLVSLMFVVYRSPDILLTQILIETVSTIFILLILFFMPPWPAKEMLSHGRKMLNVAISAGVGIVMFMFVLLSTSEAFREKANLAAPYLEKAYSEAAGSNAVNVIIVDFRAIDTTGEIVVLVIVGLCIYGLLRSRRVAA